MNTIVLGIDTSTAVSVGLARGSEVLVSLHYDDPRAHAEPVSYTHLTLPTKA